MHHLAAPVALALTASLLVAQQDRQQSMVVDATGVYVREDARTAAAEPRTTTRSTLSPKGLRWTWTSPTSADWIARDVSVGLHGTLAWIAHTLNGKKLSLTATTDDVGTPPKPIYEVPFSSDMRVRAADKSAAAVVAPATGGSMQYRRAYANSIVTTVQHTTRNNSGVEIDISEDGRYFAAGYSTTKNGSDVYVYDAKSTTPTVPIAKLNVAGNPNNFANIFRQFALSGDGSTVLLGTNTENYVFDVKTGNQLFKDSSTVSHDAHSISRDGKVWARGGFDVGAWVHNGTTYTRVLTGKGTGSMSFPVWTACDLSADGKTFVAAAYDARNPKDIELTCYRIGLTGTKILWSFAHAGGGTRQNVPQAVSLSDDGKYIAMGAWGAATNGQPEVLIFDRDKGSSPIGTIDTPGSIFDVDLSGDGRFVVAGAKKVHANTFGRGGIAYSYDLGGRTFWREGTASLGRSIKLSVDGKPAQPVLIAVGTARMAPLTLPGILGALEINPASFALPPVALGTVPTSGTLSVSFPVGTNTAAVGAELHCQCLRGGAAASFTNTLLIPVTR